MNKHRIHTTISPKHWELLQKYTEKYETQQKVIEFALGRLENIPQQNPQFQLSPEEQLYMRTCRELKSNICILHRDIVEELIESLDFERNKEILTKSRPAEHLMIWYYQKPLNKCSLKEVMDGLIFITRNFMCLLETINYTDEGAHYDLIITHAISLKFSKLINLYFEDLFKAYGVRTENEVSENGIFIKIYKNSNLNKSST